jgi:hypothetical protein
MNFNWAGQQSWSATCAATLNQNMIYRGYIDGLAGPIYGRTVVCTNSQTGEIDNFYQEYDIDESWFTGGEGSNPKADSIPDQLDFFSATAHEFGHATGSTSGADGQGHFDEANNVDECPNRVHSNFVQDRQTLCPTTPVEETYARTLGLHDTHNLDGAY